MKETKINHILNNTLHTTLGADNLEKFFLKEERPITRTEIRACAKKIVDELGLDHANSTVDQLHVLEIFSDDAMLETFLKTHKEAGELTPDILLGIQKIREVLVQELAQILDPNVFALVRSILSNKTNREGKANKIVSLHTPSSSHGGKKIIERGGRELANASEQEHQDMVTAHTKLQKAHTAYMKEHNGQPYPYILVEKSVPADIGSGKHLVEEIPRLKTLDVLLTPSKTPVRLETIMRIYSETVEACAWLASHNLLLQDLKIEDIGVYDGPQQKETAILFDLEGLIDVTTESSRHAIAVDDLNLPPEARSFATGASDKLPDRSSAEMVYQLGQILSHILRQLNSLRRNRETMLLFNSLTNLATDMMNQNPEDRPPLAEVLTELKEISQTFTL